MSGSPAIDKPQSVDPLQLPQRVVPEDPRTNLSTNSLPQRERQAEAMPVTPPIREDSLQATIDRSVEAIRETSQKLADSLGEQAVSLKSGAVKALDSALDKLAAGGSSGEESNLSEKVARKLADLIPVLGPTKAYADARAKYQAALKVGDAQGVLDARRDCIFACLELGVDLTFLPLGNSRDSLVDKMFGFVKNSAQLVLFKQARHLTKSMGIKLEQQLAEAILSSPQAVRAIDALLNFAEERPKP